MSTNRELKLNRGHREAFKEFLHDRNIDHTEKKKLFKSIFQVHGPPETLTEVDTKAQELFTVSHIIKVNNQMIGFSRRLAEDLEIQFTIHQIGTTTTQIKVTGHLKNIRTFIDLTN